MVKRQRRMTKKKGSKKVTGPKVRSPKTTKVKKLGSSSKKRPTAKTDRSNSAMKVLMKALKEKEGSE